MATAVKICGITRIEDALAAARAGAFAIGLVFYAPSPRCVTPAQARDITGALPPTVTTVGVFVDPAETEVRTTIAEAPLQLLQFSGSERPDFCRRFGRPYIKAVHMRAGVDLLQYARDYHDAKALLLDATVEGLHGGSGVPFDWNLIPRGVPLPVILSGGLTVANVKDAVRRTRPDGVDVSSGVESAKGVKDAAKIAAFIKGVRDADG
ncbi:MAG TPA: phosphoribosylanthranilate isomerase [Burkholderiales bacterium]